MKGPAKIKNDRATTKVDYLKEQITFLKNYQKSFQNSIFNDTRNGTMQNGLIDRAEKVPHYYGQKGKKNASENTAANNGPTPKYYDKISATANL